MSRRAASVAGLVGKICGSCDEVIAVRSIRSMPGGYAWHDGRHGGHTMFPGMAGAQPVQNSTAAAAARSRLPRSRRSKTSRSAPHAGGRPQSFIAALVVAHAAKLFVEYRRWSDVLERLRADGNGTYARNTLIRRVVKYSAGQNSPLQAPPARSSRRRRRPSKTGRRRLASRR